MSTNKQKNKATTYEVVQCVGQQLWTIRKTESYDYAHCDTREGAVMLINILNIREKDTTQ